MTIQIEYASARGVWICVNQFFGMCGSLVKIAIEVRHEYYH